ncbi:MAG: hypothetical protein QW199_00330 [Candidatus Pacearchaeota archaeon]
MEKKEIYITILVLILLILALLFLFYGKIVCKAIYIIREKEEVVAGVKKVAPHRAGIFEINITAPEIIEILQGETKEIFVNVTNLGLPITKLKLNLEKINESWYIINPPLIDNLDLNQTITFVITFFIPNEALGEYPGIYNFSSVQKNFVKNFTLIIKEKKKEEYRIIEQPKRPMQLSKTDVAIIVGIILIILIIFLSILIKKIKKRRKQ